MKNRILAIVLIAASLTGLLSGCHGREEDEMAPVESAAVTEDAAEETLAPINGEPYVTRWSTEYGSGEAPLVFTCPEGWTVAGADCQSDYEEVVLTNERGVKISYQYMTHSYADTGASLHYSLESEISQVSKALLDGTVPMIVAKITPTRSRYSGPGAEEEITDISDASFSYAVVPESNVGLAWRGTYEEDFFSYYDGYVQFSTQGTELTEQETEEVIQTLASLRADADADVKPDEAAGGSTLAALQRGDFSEFAGEYRMSDEELERHYMYGHTECPNIILHEDGSITLATPATPDRNSAYFPYETGVAPVSVEAYEFGCHCILWADPEWEQHHDEVTMTIGEYYSVYLEEDSNNVCISYHRGSGTADDSYGYYIKVD